MREKDRPLLDLNSPPPSEKRPRLVQRTASQSQLTPLNGSNAIGGLS